MTDDKPIHMKQSSISVPVGIFQDHLDGIALLIAWCDGFCQSGQGRVPGSFELTMHYRSLIQAVREAEKT